MADGSTNFDKVVADLQAQQQAANAANAKRMAQMMAIYDEVIQRYQPGGTFEAKALGQLEKQKTRDVGKETQQMISSGLYGTTTTAGLGRRWEESVGQPSRLSLEDIQMQRLSQAQLGQAGAIERAEDVGPDYGTIAEMGYRAGQQPTGGATAGYGGYGGGGTDFGESQIYGMGIKTPNLEYESAWDKLAFEKKKWAAEQETQKEKEQPQISQEGAGTWEEYRDREMARWKAAGKSPPSGAIQSERYWNQKQAAKSPTGSYFPPPTDYYKGKTTESKEWLGLPTGPAKVTNYGMNWKPLSYAGH